MKYRYLILALLLFACSKSYDETDVKKAEEVAILLDLNVSETFSDISKVLGVWETMPEQVRNTKNPVNNPLDFNVETGKCKKNLEELGKTIEEAVKGDIPAELEDVIENMHELYKEACKTITAPDATYDKVRKFRDKSEPEYKKMQESLTRVQDELTKKAE